MTITQEQVRSLFDYRDGELYWKVSGPGRKVGVPAGYDRRDGYREIWTKYRRYLTHRLIFLYHHDNIPEYLDHIDGNRANNEISNIREATQRENCMNQKKPKSHNGKPTSSRFKGVMWHKQHEKWAAGIRIDGKQKHLGYHTSEIDAALAYDKAAIAAFGKYALTNAMMYPEIFQNL